MRFSAVFSSVCCAGALMLAPHSSAATPEDLYLDAYRGIQEADQLQNAGRSDLARKRYEEAGTLLKKLQSSYPSYNPRAVEFRLEHLQKQISGLPAAKTEEAPAPAQKPGADSLQTLSDRVARLQAEKANLEAKLQEALAPKPAGFDPQDLAKAEERIKQLEKEKDLLRANLENVEAKKPQAADLAMLDQTRKELDATKQKLIDSIANVASLTQEKQTLQTANQKLQQQLATGGQGGDAAKQEATITELRQRIAAFEQEKEAAAKQRPDVGGNEKNRIKELEGERDAALKKLNDANREVYDLKARGQAAQVSTLTNQLANLRARLEVFEARKVPFTAEESALLDKSSKLVANTDPNAGKKSVRELPPGAGPLVKDAERAFATRRFSEAESKYKEVLKLDENNPVALANLAAIQLEMEKKDEAEKNLNKALASNAQDPYALSLLGMVRFREEKYSDALDLLSRSAQFDPKNPETQNYLGITLSQQGHREAAETALRKAIQLAPNYAGAHHNLAVIYATSKPPFLELAKYHYNKAVALGHPANPELEKQFAAVK